VGLFKIIIGLVLGVCIGIGCRLFGIPLPGPPAILGAFLAVAMATGYTVTDKMLTRNAIATTNDQPKNDDAASRASNLASEPRP
jgi:XapX domain-containing protein